MKKEFTVTGKSISEAIATAKTQVGGEVDPEGIQIDIVEQPKKGILGIGASPAVVKVTYELPDPSPALDFVKAIVGAMGLDATVTKTDTEDGVLINVEGEGTSYLIGHHGETLDSIQYLASLATNKRYTKPADGEGEEAEGADGAEGEHKYVRVMVDVAGYRAKREETLRALARRTAAKVRKTGRSTSLEPMSSYERRIVHSELQSFEGVSTHSVGNDSERRIVVSPDRGNRGRGPKSAPTSSASDAMSDDE